MSSIFITYLALIKTDKMCLCDLLLAGAMETFSRKSDHGMEVNCEEKYNFFFFSRKKVRVLLFDQRGAQEKWGGGVVVSALPCLLSVWKPLTYSAVARNVVNTCIAFRD